MSILKKLQTTGSPLSNGNGSTPKPVTEPNSKLHYSYSINGTPNYPGKPSPSKLDLDGKTPKKYLDQKIE